MSARLLRIYHSPGLQGILVPVLMLVLWEWLSRQGTAYAYAFVSLGEILRGFIGLLQSGDLLVNFLATLRAASAGLLIGGIAGLSVGIVMGISRVADTLIGPLYHSIRQVPLLGWIPLIGLWFGNGAFSKLLIISLSVFYPMVLNTYEGIRNGERNYLEVGQIFRFNRLQRLRHILLPSALPLIFSGLLNALAFAWISTVGSELLFATGPGLGGLMLTAQAASRMDIVIICIAIIGIVGCGVNFAISRLGRRFLSWRNLT